MLDLLITLGYIVVTFLVGVITTAVVYARWHYGTLERVKGLPAIAKPAFIGGSDPFFYKKVVHDEDSENVKRYGKVFGFYDGREPVIFVTDVDMIRLILVKDFDHFQNKRQLDIAGELGKEVIDFLPYKKWRVVRQFLSPSFTTGKIKAMSISVNEIVEDWLQSKKKSMTGNTLLLSKKDYGALTLDMIARNSFGLKLNSLDDPDNVFVKHVNTLLTFPDGSNFIFALLKTFPFLLKLLPLENKETTEFFSDVVRNVWKTREESGTKVNDFVDVLYDMRHQCSTDEFKNVGVSEITVMVQAIVFLGAAFDTTASTLTLLSYNLAKNPDIQKKLVKEVDDYLTRHSGKIEHETLNELAYLNACILETLRIFPSLLRIDRMCTKEWTYEPLGLIIPKGTVVQIPVFPVHFDPENFPDPHAFKPERFLPENKDKLNQYAFLSFGLGNHNCIGIRLAKENLIMSMARILQTFTFAVTADTKVESKKGSTFAFITEPFNVEAVKRN